MRRQSINIYLTVLALYDNGVLIFSILMLNLPAITDYQQNQLQAAQQTKVPPTLATLSNTIPYNQSSSSNSSASFVEFLNHTEFSPNLQSSILSPTRLSSQLFDTGQQKPKNGEF